MIYLYKLEFFPIIFRHNRFPISVHVFPTIFKATDVTLSWCLLICMHCGNFPNSLKGTSLISEVSTQWLQMKCIEYEFPNIDSVFSHKVKSKSPRYSSLLISSVKGSCVLFVSFSYVHLGNTLHFGIMSRWIVSSPLILFKQRHVFFAASSSQPCCQGCDVLCRLDLLAPTLLVDIHNVEGEDSVIFIGLCHLHQTSKIMNYGT